MLLWLERKGRVESDLGQERTCKCRRQERCKAQTRVERSRPMS